MNSAESSSRPARLPRLGLASRSFGRLWQAPVFVAGLAVFAMVAATAPLRKDPAVVQFEEDVATLRHGIVHEADTPDTLIARAENLLARLPKFTRRSGETHYLAGSAYFRLAERAAGAAAMSAREKALLHLEEAFSRGVDPADEHSLRYRLGWVLYHHGTTDKQINRAVDLMTQSVEKGADAPAVAYGLIVQAYLRRTPPDLEKARAASQRQLELTDDRNVPAMAQARLTHAMLLLRVHKRGDAIKELDRIGAGAPKEIRVKARLLEAKACGEEGMWSRAIPLWRELLGEADRVPGGKAAALYHLGYCYHEADPPAPEEAAKQWEEALALGGEEGRAAGLRLGLLHLDGSLPDPKRGLEKWSAALASLRSAADYDTRFIPIDEARGWFENAFKTFMEGQDFRSAEQLALLYARLALPGKADERLAEALHGMALEEREKIKGLPETVAVKKREELRGQFHRAAVAYEEASSRLKEPLSAMWQAGRCYLEAGDNAHGVTALERFVVSEKDEMKLAHAWLSLAEARLALGDKDKALAAYYKCIEYPDTPFAYRARYELALEETEKKNYAQARAILEQNLKAAPAADRDAQEKSVYKLAGLLILLKDYDQAAFRLKEATRLYPANAHALTARDQLAECYRRLAEQERGRLTAAKNPEMIAHYRRKCDALLEQAHTVYRDISEELEARARKGMLDATEQSLLRRALFGAADARFEGNQFPEALRLYQGIQARYRRRIDSLLACQRIFKCFGVMPPAEFRAAQLAALEAVALAREDLAVLPPEADVFQGPGVWSHREWTTRLDEMQERLRTPPGAESKGMPVVR